MREFTNKQLETMASQGGPRGAKAQAEIERRKNLEKGVDTKAKAEVESSPEVEDKPKRTTRRKRTTGE